MLNAAIKRDPAFLNNKTISGATLYKVVDSSHPENGHGLVLEDVVIKNFIMSNVTLYNVRFKNVTFVDCVFVKTRIEDGTFENVKFIRGNMFAYDEPDAYPPPETTFGFLKGIKIDRVLFDGVKIGKNVHMFIYDGVVVMRNILVDTGGSKEDYKSFVIQGIDLQVRIDNCNVKDKTSFLIGGDTSSAYITNSTFNDSMIKIQGTAAWVENCTITDSDLPSSKTVVIKNNRLVNNRVISKYDDGKVFLVDNNYDLMKIDGKYPDRIGMSSIVYIYNSKIPGEVGVGYGSINIYDSTIGKLKLYNEAATHGDVKQPSGTTGIAELNLSNVTIGQGDWEGAELQQGKWNNVQLGPLNLNEAKIGVITGYRVGHFGSGLKFRESSQPLQIDKPPVPTLEELGLAQFWKENDFPQEQY